MLTATDPTIIDWAIAKSRVWLKPVAERGEATAATTAGAAVPLCSTYLTDGRAMYRLVSLLGAPVVAVVLEDCHTLSECLCTDGELRAMRLRLVSVTL